MSDYNPNQAHFNDVERQSHERTGEVRAAVSIVDQALWLDEQQAAAEAQHTTERQHVSAQSVAEQVLASVASINAARERRQAAQAAPVNEETVEESNAEKAA